MKKYMHSHSDAQPYWQRLPAVTTNLRTNTRIRRKRKR